MMAMLGMYDMPALQPANDRFWQAIRNLLGEGPAHLSRDHDFMTIWQSPDLLLAQTCGMPFRTRLHGHVALIGTPDYGLPGCPAGHYNSVLVVHKDATGTRLSDFAGSTLAYNDGFSQSGWAAPMNHLRAAHIHIGDLYRSGGHANSARAIAEGRADIAGLDALTWKLLQEHDPALAGQLRELETTPPTPGLPYITAGSRDPVPIAAAIRHAIETLAPRDRAALHLKGLETIPARDYLAVPNPAAP